MKRYSRSTGAAFALFAGVCLVTRQAEAALLLDLESTNYSAGVWTDVSGNGNNATQSTPANQPTLVFNATPNGKPAVQFAQASSDSLNLTTTISLSGTYTYLFAGDPYFDAAHGFSRQGGVIGGGWNSAPNYIFRSYGYDNGQMIYDNGFGIPTSPNAGPGWKVFALTDDGTTISIYTNGVFQSIYTGAIAANGGNLVSVGYNAPAGYFDGPMAALQVYDTTLSASAIYSISQSIANAYGIPEPSVVTLLAVATGVMYWRRSEFR